MSAARVYLMADFGKGPRCVAQDGRGLSEFNANNDDNPDTRRCVFGFDPHARWCSSNTASRIVIDARAWWLVEAESAEAARAIIELGPCGHVDPNEATARCRHCGGASRTLASGSAPFGSRPPRGPRTPYPGKPEGA